MPPRRSAKLCARLAAATITSEKGGTETTYRYSLLEPGCVQRRVELDPFKVIGRLTIAEQRKGRAASEAFAALGKSSLSALTRIDEAQACHRQARIPLSPSTQVRPLRRSARARTTSRAGCADPESQMPKLESW